MERPILNDAETAELQEGYALYEMTQSAGFKVLSKKLEEVAYHSWADPREAQGKDEWMWREMVSWAAANNARELLEFIQSRISRAEYLDKKRKGELSTKPMRIE